MKTGGKQIECCFLQHLALGYMQGTRAVIPLVMQKPEAQMKLSTNKYKVMLMHEKKQC